MDPALVQLLSVLLGGVLGLAGGVIAPWMLETRKQEAEKKKKRVEKFEELIAIVHEHHHWLDIARSVRTFGKETILAVSPMTKGLAIVTIYFPELYEDMKGLDLAGGEFEKWQFAAGQKRMQGVEN